MIVVDILASSKLRSSRRAEQQGVDRPSSRSQCMKRALPLVVTSMMIGLAACASSPDETFYTALGGSDAVGIGATPPTEGYVFRIQDELEEKVAEVPFVNLGLPGADVAAIENALDTFLATGRDPDLVTLWTGPNDVIRGDDPEDFESDLGDILAQLHDETDAVIVMANVPELTELPRFEEEPDPDVTKDRIEAFNQAIERQAGEFDASVVDLHEEGMEDDLVSDADGFHANNEGHRQISERFLEVISPKLGL
jgi:acyl-CoA thioesterase I